MVGPRAGFGLWGHFVEGRGRTLLETDGQSDRGRAETDVPQSSQQPSGKTKKFHSSVNYEPQKNVGLLKQSFYYGNDW